jgi:hypothetical protein
MKRVRVRAANKNCYNNNSNNNKYFIPNVKKEELAKFNSSNSSFYRQIRNAASKIIRLLYNI